MTDALSTTSGPERFGGGDRAVPQPAGASLSTGLSSPAKQDKSGFDRDRSTPKRVIPQHVECPFCNAPPYVPCFTSGANERKRPHVRRTTAWIQSHPDYEWQKAKYEAMQAEGLVP